MTETVNPLLSKIHIPGKRFRLPSRGLFYTNGELADTVVDGEISINSMTTVDEITLRSPEYLFTGEAIERVFKRCIPEVLEPLKLLSLDVDYLLACLRIVSYGGVYQLDTRCPKCEEKQEEQNEIEIEKFYKEIEEKALAQNIPLEIALEDTKVREQFEKLQNKRSPEEIYNIDLMGIIQNNTIEIDENNHKDYKLELSNGQIVQMSPLRMDSAVAVLRFQNDENDLNLETMEDFVSFMLASTIISVDDITDRDMIEEWAATLPTKYKEEIDKASKKLKDWGPDFSYTITCMNPSCGYKWDIATLLNPINFFMTPSELEEKNN